MLTSGSAHHGSSICTCQLATFQGPIWNPTAPQPKHPPTSISSLPASTIFSPQPRPFSINLGPACSINLDKAPPPLLSPGPQQLNDPSASADQFKLVPPSSQPPLENDLGRPINLDKAPPPLHSAPPASDAPLPPLLSLSLDRGIDRVSFWVGEPIILHLPGAYFKRLLT
ncbi:hypothetical protein PGTUg99_011696 [Puccinia graminis f. sp. tritici]|uniref:Uncharacterized protein n=1 Tax=Puccinia graminis f. sp. tritici TaxID=56615 RepID=A0A5B0RKA0_PUCGR|nr:hypothetical protein PGTUg99_011696 [Puccinia graminis f. sp. tritici]